MSESNELRETYNRIAADYNDDHEADTWDDDFRVAFCSLLPAHARILDLGCGPGTDSKLLVESGLTVTGFDLSDELLKIAANKNPSVEFIQGDMRKLPLSDNSFDGVFAKASLLHIPKSDMPMVLKEIKRVVIPEGIVHIAIKGGEGEQIETENKFGYTYKRFFSYWQAELFSELLAKEGFSIVRLAVKAGTTTTWLQYLLRTR
jgi:ubiquinone/menaquinone biosynthesis C-methylase UbiE